MPRGGNRDSPREDATPPVAYWAACGIGPTIIDSTFGDSGESGAGPRHSRQVTTYAPHYKREGQELGARAHSSTRRTPMLTSVSIEKEQRAGMRTRHRYP